MEDTQPGRRLLVNRVDELASREPDRVVLSYSRSPDLSKGFRDITCRCFANAVNRAAHWIEETFVGSGAAFETIGYLGPGDVRYFIFMLAGNKTGFKFLFPSPRNSLEGQLNLIDNTQCTKFVRSDPINMDDILDKRKEMKCVTAPTLEHLLDETAVPHYAFQRGFKEAHSDPLVVMHTSGSTGLPKPVVSPQDAACTQDACNLVPPFHGKPYFYAWFARECPRFYSSLPFFHAAGIIMGLMQPYYFGNTAVFGPPARPLSAGLIDEIIDHGNVNGIFSPPSLVEEISKTPASLDRLAKLRMVFVGAGPLSTPAGTTVSKKVFLAIGAGSTEAYLMLTHAPDPEDWRYFLINSEEAGIEWRKDPESDLHEMVYIRKPEKEHYQAIFKTFRDKEEYATGDLFEKHPEKPDRWRIVGRKDDMLVLNNGEKVQSRAMEDTLSGHTAVREALVIGQGRFHTAAILELRQYPPQQDEKEPLMEDIWPVVEAANSQAPSHARLLRPFVFFASPGKPFIRVGKGSVSKPATLKLYAEEIDELYRSAEASIMKELDGITELDVGDLTRQIRAACHKLFGFELASARENFFHAGVDSLGAMTLASALRKSMRKLPSSTAERMNVRMVYEHPSIEQISLRVYRLIHNSDEREDDSGSDAIEQIRGLADRSIKHADLAGLTRVTKRPHIEPVILLTGSTGFLGSYILNELLLEPDIKEIICVNRTLNGHQRQTEVSAARGLQTAFDKVTFYCADLAKQDLGLLEADYKEACSRVTGIIHCQWTVDFNMNLATFERHVQGVANLARFAAQAPSQVPICFLSSVSAVENWSAASSEPVPEEPLSYAGLTRTGYGQSKLAASMVLEQAAQEGSKSIILRIGQVAGPLQTGTKGEWSRHEWFPSLIASSCFLGQIPDSLGTMDRIDWIPVDVAAKSVVEVAKAFMNDGQQVRTTYTHIACPHASSWQHDILPSVQRHYGTDLRLVTSLDWLEALKSVSESESSASSVQTSNVPGSKLVDFYETMFNEGRKGRRAPRLATERAQNMSLELRNAQPVSGELMSRWLKAWSFDTLDNRNKKTPTPGN